MVLELILVRPYVAAGKAFFQMFEEGRVDGHHVLEVAVNGAVLDHQDLAVALNDLRFNLAYLVVEQDGQRLLAAQDFRPNLGDTAWAQRIGFPRPA
jgi:hypothetical protein